MADILLDEQATPTTPASGQGVHYIDNQASSPLHVNDAGLVQGALRRGSSGTQTGFSADTYVLDSGLIIPSKSMQLGMFWEWKIVATKTAAGVAAPVYQVRIGPNQTTADTSRISITGPAQTAVVDTALITILVTCVLVGTLGNIRGAKCLRHNLAATGFAVTGPAGFSLVEVTSGVFNNTILGGQFIGLSINAGAAASWSLSQCVGRAYYR